MKILALEFSSPQRSVAVACGTVHVREVIEAGRGHTMRPFAMIETALTEANLERQEIECVVVGLGPGSYTGIRAGIALAQGWQLAHEVKLLGVSSAEAVAARAQADGLRGVANVVLDAQRGEFYVGAWQLSDTGWRELEPLRIVSGEEINTRIGAGQVIIGPEVTRWFPAGRVLYPRAETLARLAADRTDFVSGERLEPIYLRETNFVKAPPPRGV
jgi:tRNA threonylcarbamoyl adenosine modification protein YeaZ